MKKIIKFFYVLIILITSSFAFNINVQASTTNDYLKKSMYYHMENMDEEFKFIYDGNIDSAMDLIEEASKCGKYTFLNVTNCKLEQYGNQFTAKMTYYVNKSQDNYVNSVLEQAIKQNTNNNMSAYDKVAFVNKYLINKLEYDRTMTSYDPYTALTTGKTVCQGYSMLAAKMYNMLGIKNEIVIGYLDKESHGWNRVKIGKHWYNIDTTNCDALRNDTCLFLKSDITFKTYGFRWDSTSVTELSEYDYDDISHDNDRLYQEALPAKVQGANTWYKKNNWWFYRDLEGNNAVGWLYYGGRWYYLDQYGRMQTGWIKYNGKWYYFALNGAMQTGKKYIDGKWYYLDEIGELVS